MTGVNSRRYVTVPAATLWTSPTAPRDVDRRAIAPRPDMPAWLADLDSADARLSLHGRVLSQLERAEPVRITGQPDGSTATSAQGSSERPADERWLQVVAPMQPSSRDARGYPGWVLAAHVRSQVPDRSPLRPAADALDDDAGAGGFLAVARAYLGPPYLWGGMCDGGLDCSGLWSQVSTSGLTG